MEVMQPEPAADHSPPSSTKFKNARAELIPLLFHMSSKLVFN